MTIKNKASTKSKLSKNFATVTSRLLELIERGTVPWHQPWQNVGYQNLITQKPYSGVNPIICATDSLYFNYTSPYFIGIGQCKDKSWSIKKGSKATWLRWGGTTKVTDRVEDEQGVREKERFVRAFKWLMVFNLSCVDDSQSEIKIAEEMPKLTIRLEPVKDKKIESFVEATGVDVTYTGNQAYHDFRNSKIYLPHRRQFNSRDSFWSTLFHELVHSTAKELNRPHSGDLNDPIYHQEELIADIGASFLGNHFNLAKTELEHHASYLTHYWQLLNLDELAFFKAVYEAQKAVDYLLGLGESCGGDKEAEK